MGRLCPGGMRVKTRIVTISGGSAEAAKARDALGMLSGVVAAEFVPGRNAVKVFCGDEMTQDMLSGYLRDRGIGGM